MSDSGFDDSRCREWQERCRALFDSLDAVYVHDLEGRFLDVNEAALQLTGYSRDEILRVELKTLLDASQIERVRGALAELGQTGNLTTRPEFRIRRKDGTFVDVETNASVIRHDGHPYAVLGIARDTTKLKQAERAVAAQNATLLQLTRCSIELSMTSSLGQLEALIVRQLMELTGAVAAGFAEYDPMSRTTTNTHVQFESDVQDEITRLIGRGPVGFSTPISDESYRQISEDFVHMVPSLEAASFGSLTRAVAEAVQAALGADRFFSLGYPVDGSVYGTSLLALGAGRPEPSEELLKNYCSIVALALRRAMVETALRASEEKYRTVVENIREGVLVVSADGVLYYNHRVPEMLGYSHEEMDRLDFGAALHPDDRPRALSELTGMLKHGAPAAHETRMVTKTGDLITVSTHVSAIEWQGRPAAIVFLEDVTGRKRAESDEQLRREILQILNERGDTPRSVSEVVDLIKRGTGFDAVGIRLGDGNDYPYIAQDGFSNEVLAAENSLLEHDSTGGICRDANGRPKLACACGQVIAGNADPRLEVYTKGGSFWTNEASLLLDLDPAEDPRFRPRNVCITRGHESIALIPIRDKQKIVGLLHLGDQRPGRLSLDAIGRLEGIAAHIGGALLRRAAETALRESEERYQTLVSLSPDAIVVDDDGLFVYANVAAARLFGARSPEELIGCEVAGFVHPESRELDVEAAGLLASAGMLPPREVKLLRLDGTEVPVEATAVRVEFNGHQVNQLVYRDITARKDAEAKQRELEQQLQERQKLESLGVLAGGIAHDFNNMLTAIIGYSDLILESRLADPEESLGDVREIREAAERAKDLTGAILAFSRRQPREPQILALNTLVADLSPLLRRTIGEHIEVVFRLPYDELNVEADPSQLTQVTMNLVVNARDAMPSGGRLTIEVRRRTLDETAARISPVLTPGDWVVLTVRDTGTGMDDEVRARIFEPFFTTKRQGEGTGLGLSTAYGVVRQSGGEIVVSSRLGEGSTFDVYLPSPDKTGPAARATESPTAGRGGVTAHAEARPSAPGQRTVLLVEDEPAVQRLAVRLLEDLGCRVLVAGDGGQALAVASTLETDIHLLLTDLVLPGGLQGDDVARAVVGERPGVKVMFMSGYPRNVMLEGGRLIEGIDFLDKPFVNDDFTARVRRALEL